MADEKTLGRVLLDLYRPRFEEQFRNHPKGKEIVELMCQGDNPPELVDLWFAEAESYNWKTLMSAAPRGPSGQPIKFQVIKGEN